MPGLRFQYLWPSVAILFLALLAVPAVDGQADPAGTLPEDYLPALKPILTQALKQSPEMILRQLELAQSETGILDADAARWPQVGGNIRYDSNRTAATNSAPSVDSGLFYSLSANQAVFHWGAIKHRSQIARIEVAIAQKNFAEGYRTLAVELRRAYLDLIALKARLRSAEYAMSLRQADLATAKARLAIGSSSPGEISGRELDINEAQLGIDRVQTEFDAARRSFSRIAGISPDIAPDDIPDAIPEPRYDAALAADLLASVLRDAGRGTFAAQAAELHIKEADLNYRIARVRLLPKFNAGLGHSRESSTTATATHVSQVAITRDSIELRGDWTIFDGFATRAAKQRALTDKRTWERRRDDAAEAVMDQAQQLRRIVDIDARAADIAARRRQMADVALKRAEEDLKSAGSTSQSAVDAARRDLRTADWNLATARSTYLADWSAFVSLAEQDPALKNLPPRYVSATR